MRNAQTRGDGGAVAAVPVEQLQRAGRPAERPHALVEPIEVDRVDHPDAALDLEGVRDALPKNVIATGDSIVKKIRVSQFKGAPDPVTRVVLDLDAKTPYHVVQDGASLRVTFGESVPIVSKSHCMNSRYRPRCVFSPRHTVAM